MGEKLKYTSAALLSRCLGRFLLYPSRHPMDAGGGDGIDWLAVGADVIREIKAWPSGPIAKPGLSFGSGFCFGSAFLLATESQSDLLFLLGKARILLDSCCDMPLTTGMTMNLEATESTAEETDGRVHADLHAAFVLQKVQPALLGLMDGSVSTLAPLFAAAGLTHNAYSAFLIGLATSVGAGVSMGLAEALSDDGKVTGRGTPIGRGVITGAATILGGMLHTLPFLIPNLSVALRTAYVVVLIELVAIAYIRFHFMKTPLVKTVVQVIVGGLIVFGIGIWLGRIGAAG